MDPSTFQLPEQRGIFERLSPAQFRAVSRKAQGLTDIQSAREGGIARKTISSYIDTARRRLKIGSTQELLWQYYSEYSYVLLFPEGLPPESNSRSNPDAA